MSNTTTPEQQSTDMELAHERLTRTVDVSLKHADERHQAKMAVLDKKFERLLDWARKVSEKTGIPLENL